MLTYLLIVGAIVCGWLTVRHINGEKAPVLIGLVVVLLVAGGVVEWRWRAMDDRYSDATQRLLHRDDTYVVCERLSGALFNVWNRAGYVAWTPDGSRPRRADLTWDTCRDLRAWERDGKHATDIEQVTAVHVLTHEAMHLAGYYNEAEAECAAMQFDSETAQLLGATPQDADALAWFYWTRLYPHMRDDYRSEACTPNGAWDQSPSDGSWP